MSGMRNDFCPPVGTEPRAKSKGDILTVQKETLHGWQIISLWLAQTELLNAFAVGCQCVCFLKVQLTFEIIEYRGMKVTLATASSC